MEKIPKLEFHKKVVDITYYSQFQKLNYIIGINFNQDRTN